MQLRALDLKLLKPSQQLVGNTRQNTLGFSVDLHRLLNERGHLVGGHMRRLLQKHSGRR
jgi:hypothetical protein